MYTFKVYFCFIKIKVDLFIVIIYLSVKDSIDLVWHTGDVGYADDAFLHKDCFVHFC